MPSPLTRSLLALLFAPSLAAAAPAAGPSVEPGLEKAVRWIWTVESSPVQAWGLPLAAIPVAPVSLVPGANPATTGVSGTRADSYTVQRGDALYTIGKRYKVPVDLLKEVNGLSNNTIHIGQILRIPSPEEVRARAAAAPTPAPKKGAALATPAPAVPDYLALQVFLDRQGFSPGPIDGQNSADLQQTLALYLEAHPEAKDPATLAHLMRSVGEPIGTYTLRPEDYRFITPPRAAKADAEDTAASSTKKRKASKAGQAQPRITYQDLVSLPLLAYRTPWEFVAERFHCNEAYLRHLNPQLRDVPVIGTQLRVPNVTPFSIERAGLEALQPPASPQNSYKAAIVDLIRLEITQNGELVAVYPLSIARPGLRGREPWVIADAIPRPQLVTEQELRVKPQAPVRIYGRDDPDATPPPVHVHEPVHQTLAAGPNNPVGILWINLAKPGEATSLPYGLTGTSSPDHMRGQESLGGLRLANWDIARAVRQLPPGTPLEWRTTGPAKPSTAVAQPAM